MRIARLGFLILLVSGLGAGVAQPQEQTSATPDQQTDTLAAAARRAREEKKSQPKAAKVWDNDNIPATSGGISVVGSAAAPEQPAQNPPAGAAAENKQAQSVQGKAAVQADLDAAKEELASLKTDLDIAQRKYTLDQQTYYSKPDYSSDKAGAAALKDEQDQIDAKQQEVADAQKKVDDLQGKLDAAK